MMRNTTLRALRPLARPAPFRSLHTAGTRSILQHDRSVALSAFRARPTALVRAYASKPAPGTSQSLEKEAQFARGKLQPNPDGVSTTSSMQPILTPRDPEAEPDVDMMAGIRHDVKVIRDTFALNEVPTHAYRLGLAGVLPYLATSASTVYLAFELNHAHANAGIGWLLSESTANSLLQILEPVQVGYGAVILSFLGAIHWGLEWAKFGGEQGYRRYAIGVLAPAIAWPTILLPVEYALISQFLAFNLLYAADAQTTHLGWTPQWYSTYRFILTFIVGASIVVSLIGRGQIVERVGKLPSTTDRIRELREEQDKLRTLQAEAAEGEGGEEEEE